MKTPPAPRCERPSPYRRPHRSSPAVTRRWGPPNIQQSTPGPSVPHWKGPRESLFLSPSPISFDSDSEPDDLERAGVQRIIKRARKPSNGVEVDVDMTSGDERTFLPDHSVFGFDDEQTAKMQNPSPTSMKSNSTSAVETLVTGHRISQKRPRAEVGGRSLFTVSQLTSQSPECIVLDDNDSDDWHTQYHTPLHSTELSRVAPRASAAPRPHHTADRKKSPSRLRRDSSEIVSVSDVFPPPLRRALELDDEEDSVEEREKLFKLPHRKAAHILGVEVCKQIIREALRPLRKLTGRAQTAH